MTDLLQREVGWVVTQDLDSQLVSPTTRVGWGQLRVHADETAASYNLAMARTIFMDKSLTEHMIPEEARVRWRSFSDDMDPTYGGVMNVAWLWDDDDLAYNIDRFNMEDAGAVKVYYSTDDIIKAAQAANRPAERYDAGYGAIKLDGADGSWVQIYG